MSVSRENVSSMGRYFNESANFLSISGVHPYISLFLGYPGQKHVPPINQPALVFVA